MKDSPLQKQTLKNIEIYFANAIEPQHFAAQIRGFMHAAVAYYLEDDCMTYQTEIKQGYLQLTEFLEQIDPLMENNQ